MTLTTGFVDGLVTCSAIALSPEMLRPVSERFLDPLLQRRAIQTLAQVRSGVAADPFLGPAPGQAVLLVDAGELPPLDAPRQMRRQAEVGPMVAVDVEA